MFIGCHLSVSKGFAQMGQQALSIGANTFQFFTRNPRGGSAKAISEPDVQALNTLMTENHFGPVIAHAPYTLNACAKDERLRTFALETMIDDLNRLSYLPSAVYNFHPGSHVGQGIDKGISLICELLEKLLETQPKTPVLLETMSGKGSEVGHTFEQIGQIIKNLGNAPELGVCMDTCHIWSAGYDIVSHLDDVLADFDKHIGLSRLKAVHLNDSMTPFDARKDRHAKLGEGTIGVDALVRFVSHPKLKHLPFCLETPNEIDGYEQEIALMKSLCTA